MKLEVEKLRSGRSIVRPAGTCGTCGWSPLAWIVTYVYPRETPKAAFLRANPKWKEILE